MAAIKILVPYNYNAYEEKALDFVINAFSSQRDAKVTLFNAYTPLPEVDMDASPELSKMRDGMVSLSEELREKEEGLKSAMQHMIDNGFSQDQIDYIFKEKQESIAEEIMQTALKGHYRVLVLSRQPAKVTRLFGRGVHSKILSALKDVVVCVAT